MISTLVVVLILTAQTLICDPSVELELIVHQDSINATVGQSLLLPTSYTIRRSVSHWPSIQWTIGNRMIVYFSALNGSINTEGFPTWISGKTITYPMHQGRVEFYPMNASLLLEDLQLNDSGTYHITLLHFEKIIKKNLSVWVHEDPASFEEDTAQGRKLLIFIFRTMFCLLPIVALGSLIRRWECQ
ncbi:hypothetical protein FKM82_027569 [Ascaphus truei]